MRFHNGKEVIKAGTNYCLANLDFATKVFQSLRKNHPFQNMVFAIELTYDEFV